MSLKKGFFITFCLLNNKKNIIVSIFITVFTNSMYLYLLFVKSIIRRVKIL